MKKNKELLKAVEVKNAQKNLMRLNLQHFAEKSTLFELKQNMATIGQQLQKVETELSQKAVDPSASIEDLKALQQTTSDLKMRFDVVKEQHDKMEAEQTAAFQANKGIKGIEDPKQREVKAKAELVRATLTGKAISADVRQALGDETTTNGGKFLPKTVSTSIISEPTVKNQLREISTFTNITNLEIPKITFSLGDDAFIADKATAKELAATGASVQFTRNKFKVFCEVSETVLNGSDVNLVAYVERALQSGVAAKEKKVAFAASPATGEQHMSFYHTSNGIASVNGADTYTAIKGALAALHEDYRENATIVMTYADYLGIIEKLSNGNTSLYGVQPEQIFGKPIVFSDAATKPIIGDFSYSHFNYDLDVLFDRDKDVKTGLEVFVITAWMDHRIKLASAFRIANVTTTP